MAERADAVVVVDVVGCCKDAEVYTYQWRRRDLRMRQHEPTQNEDISLLVTHFQHDNKFSIGKSNEILIARSYLRAWRIYILVAFAVVIKNLEVLG